MHQYSTYRAFSPALPVQLGRKDPTNNAAIPQVPASLQSRQCSAIGRTILLCFTLCWMVSRQSTCLSTFYSRISLGRFASWRDADPDASYLPANYRGATATFITSFLAIVPLAGLLGEATEQVALSASPYVSHIFCADHQCQQRLANP